MLAETIILIVIVLGIGLALITREESLGALFLFIVIPFALFEFSSILHPLLFVAGSIPCGLLLGRFAYDEIVIGKRWIMLVSGAFGIVFLMGLFGIPEIMWFGAFGALTSLISLTGKSKL